MDDRWLSYLYRAQSEETLRAWAKRLSLFRFLRAIGGHANDGDALVAVYRYESTSQLHDFFARLGISLVQHQQKPPQATPGVSYSGDGLSRFPSLIPGSEWLEQPARRELAGQSVFIWCSQDQIRLSIAQGYELTEADARSAELVESVLQDVSLPRVDPPVDDERCVCPQYYPDFFRDG